MEEIDSRFLDVFLEEAAELLANLENDLIDLEKNKTSDEVINKVFRAFHTFKGSAGIIGFYFCYFNDLCRNSLDDGRW